MKSVKDKLICLTPTFPPRSLLSALCSLLSALCSLLFTLYSLPLSPLPSTLYPLNFSSLSHHCSRISNTRFSSEAGSMVVFWLFGRCGRVGGSSVVFGVNRVFNQCVHSKHVWRLGTSVSSNFFEFSRSINRGPMFTSPFNTRTFFEFNRSINRGSIC